MNSCSFSIQKQSSMWFCWWANFRGKLWLAPTWHNSKRRNKINKLASSQTYRTKSGTFYYKLPFDSLVVPKLLVGRRFRLPLSLSPPPPLIESEQGNFRKHPSSPAVLIGRVKQTVDFIKGGENFQYIRLCRCHRGEGRDESRFINREKVKGKRMFLS